MWIRMSLMVFLLLSLSFAQGISYSLHMELDRGILKFSDIRLVNGPAPSRPIQPSDGYNLSVYSFDGHLLHSFRFNIYSDRLTALDHRWFDENNTQIFFPNDSIQTESHIPVYLAVPYFPDGRELTVAYPNGSMAVRVDLSAMADPRIVLMNSPLPWVAGLVFILVLAGVVGFVYKKRGEKI